MNKHSETAKFTKLSISRYTSIPIDIDYINLVLCCSFSIAIHGPHEEKTAELIEIMNQDDGQILKTLTQASIPQFFIDKGTSYVAHPGYWE